MIYETEQDREREREILPYALAYLGLARASHLSMAQVIDYLMVDHRGEPGAFAEVKDRPTLSWGFRDGLYLSKNKAEAAERFGERTGLGAHLFVRLKDRTIWHVPMFRFVPGKVIMFGRTDRGDPRDITPCHVYPWPEFKQVAA